jgi:hypothetical protein
METVLAAGHGIKTFRDHLFPIFKRGVTKQTSSIGFLSFTEIDDVFTKLSVPKLRWIRMDEGLQATGLVISIQLFTIISGFPVNIQFLL